MPRTSCFWKSTVETFVIPPLWAADEILASTPKFKTSKNPVPVDLPILVPIGLLVADTGMVIEQDVIAKIANAPINSFTFFILYIC